jgi:hypothetical protein
MSEYAVILALIAAVIGVGQPVAPSSAAQEVERVRGLGVDRCDVPYRL